MFYNILTENDYKNLEELKKITESISNLYDKLCNLEISGNKNTEDYKRIYEYLMIAVEVENNQYKSMNLNYSKIAAFLEYINLNLKKNVPEGIINQHYNSKIDYRMLKKFLKFLHDNEIFYSQYMNDVLYTKFDAKENNIELIKKESELDFALQSDIDYSFACNLQKLIDNELYEIYRKQLIMTKYMYFFIYDDLLCNILLLNVSSFDAIIKSYDMIDEEKVKFVVDTQFDNLKENIIKLLGVPDYKCQKKNTLIKLLLRQCYINAYLEKFELPSLYQIDDEIEIMINKYNYYTTHSISTSLLVNSIRGTISDKVAKLLQKKKIKN